MPSETVLMVKCSRPRRDHGVSEGIPPTHTHAHTSTHAHTHTHIHTHTLTLIAPYSFNKMVCLIEHIYTRQDCSITVYLFY